MPSKTPSTFWLESVAAVLEDHDVDVPADLITSIAAAIEEAATSCTASAPDPGWSEPLAREIRAAEVRGAQYERRYVEFLKGFPGYQRENYTAAGPVEIERLIAQAGKRPSYP
jgi:hypothetical protein